MKDTQLDIIETHPYKEFIIIPIRKEVSKLFDSEKISFQCAIIDDKLILTSPKIKAELGSSENHTQAKVEVSNV